MQRSINTAVFFNGITVISNKRCVIDRVDAQRIGTDCGCHRTLVDQNIVKGGRCRLSTMVMKANFTHINFRLSKTGNYQARVVGTFKVTVRNIADGIGQLSRWGINVVSLQLSRGKH